MVAHAVNRQVRDRRVARPEKPRPAGRRRQVPRSPEARALRLQIHPRCHRLHPGPGERRRRALITISSGACQIPRSPQCSPLGSPLLAGRAVAARGLRQREGESDERVAGTVTLIIDGDAVIVVDPGMVAYREGLLAARPPAARPRGRDRRGVQPPPSRSHGQRRAVPRGPHPRPLGHRTSGDRWVDRAPTALDWRPRSACCAPRPHRRGHLHRGATPKASSLHPRLVGTRERPRRRTPSALTRMR